MLNQNFILTVYTLWLRELTRFYRQPSRLMGALGTPLVFWILIGSGIGSSFSRMNYLIYFFPGTILMILLFTAIFSTISLIEDRHEGFLQSVLVAPVPRSGLVLGKILGGSTLAFLQGFIFLLMAPLIGLSLTFSAWTGLALVLFINAFALTGLGFIVAWKLRSIQGFHAVMNLFLMPLWFLSGALFPQEGAPAWLRFVMNVNPLTYGLSALRRILFSGNQSFQSLPGLKVSIGISIVFGLVMFGIASLTAQRRKVEDLG
ncbi:MAG TPA: ABC transporter permease, partial [bacterium]|nr:ABC transporter permease [bacterium]